MSEIEVSEQSSSTLDRLDAFHAGPRSWSSAGDAAGFTLETQPYIRPGELMVRDDEAPPLVGRRFRANLFWMGRASRDGFGRRCRGGAATAP